MLGRQWLKPWPLFRHLLPFSYGFGRTGQFAYCLLCFKKEEMATASFKDKFVHHISPAESQCLWPVKAGVLSVIKTRSLCCVSLSIPHV